MSRYCPRVNDNVAFSNCTNCIERECDALEIKIEREERKPNTIGEVLDILSDYIDINNLLIMYRMFITDDETNNTTDEFLGYCRYKDNELIPESNEYDLYHIKDLINGFEYREPKDEEPYLVIWKI